MTVYLIGSMQGSLASSVVADALGEIGKPRPRVAVSYAPCAENADSIPFVKKTLERVFEDTGAELERFVLPGEADAGAADEAQRIVEGADLVLLSGGDPVVGARLFTESGADAWLRGARARGTACAGISAGAILLGAFWASWSEDEEQGEREGEGELVRCTGVVPDLVVDCDDEEDDWRDLRLVTALLAERPEVAGMRVLGIPAGGAVVVAASGALQVVGDEPLRLNGTLV